MDTFLGTLATGVRCTVEPLMISLRNEASFRKFLQSFGWDVEISAASMATIRAGFALESLFNTVRTLANQLESGTADELAVAGELVDTLRTLIESIQALTTTPPTGLPFPLDQPDFWNQVPRELADYLLIRFLEKQYTPLYAALVTLGLAELEQVNPTGTGRIPYKRLGMHWERLPRVVSDPAGLFRELYHWNDSAHPFNHQRFLGALEVAFRGMGLPTHQNAPRAALTSIYYSPTNPSLPQVRELAVPFFTSASNDRTNFNEFGFLILPIPPRADTNQPPVGFLVTPLIEGSVGTGVDTGSPYTLTLRGGFQTDGAFGAEFRPDGLDLRFAPATITIDAQLAFAARQPAEPWLLVGSPNSHRVEAGGLFVSLRVRGPVTDPEFIIEFGTGEDPVNPPKIAVIIQASEADGFLRELIGNEPQRMEFGGKLTWSSKTGLTFSGTAGIRLVIPINRTIGVVEINSLLLAFDVAGTGAELTAAVTGGAHIGPVAASVQNIGLKFLLRSVAAGQPRGLLGGLDLEFGFKPPDGLGIVIDAGPITGGGFLSFDQPQGRYFGKLQLEIYSISVTAIGLLDTRLPGGVEGYSFLIIISVEFPPIQLGFGFTLNGVGGLAGIHRTVVTEVLQTGIRNHSVDRILFPEDPIHNAPQIISDLSRVFPPARDRFVFGPMAIIGWGTPTLIRVEIGIILELPAPVRIIILGQISAALPTEDAAIVELHIDVLGIIDFGQKLLSIDATLHDSRIAMFTIYGDMALRLSWGEPPSFAFSLGGFNPHFQPPPNFPTLRRLTIALGAGDNPRLSCQAYMALTSNTVQFGALVELYAAAAGFNVRGWIGFDVLVIFSPFSFRADFSAGVELRRGNSVIAGIHLNATLTGPSPFHAWGEACISLFFFDICVPFDATFGEERREELPPTDPWPRLQEAIQDARNWSAALPPAAFQVVTLTTPTPGTGTAPPVLVDPVGSATLRQKVLPLNHRITKFGETEPTGPDHYNLSGVRVGSAAVVNPTVVKDYFAPAQFEEMDDAQKLSRPSFELMDAGIALGSDVLTHGGAKGTDIAYETIIIDSPWDSRPAPLYMLPLTHQLSMLERGAAALSPLNNSGINKFGTGAGLLVELDEEEFVIASALDLSMRADISAPATKGGALQTLAAYLEANPHERGQLQVVPLHEVEGA